MPDYVIHMQAPALVGFDLEVQAANEREAVTNAERLQPDMAGLFHEADPMCKNTVVNAEDFTVLSVERCQDPKLKPKPKHKPYEVWVGLALLILSTIGLYTVIQSLWEMLNL